jgi:hypothetical protein
MYTSFQSKLITISQTSFVNNKHAAVLIQGGKPLRFCVNHPGSHAENAVLNYLKSSMRRFEKEKQYILWDFF